ncbi:MAG: N-formylglutamate amidohydrolase [Hyphomicrobiaceae bacterium]
MDKSSGEATSKEQERAAIEAELTPGFVVFEPDEQLTPFVFCSPHSGRQYPKVLLQSARLDAHALRKSEDCFVDELFAGVRSLGAPLVAARFPRAYLDVNREPFELDPELFGRGLPSFANAQSIRVAGGLGTIARIVADGEEIYSEPPTIEAALERIELLYQPFHAKLSQLLEATRERFGMVVLIDCHSMPSAAMSNSSTTRPDFVIGDRFGASCDPRLTRLIRDQLARQGYQALLNRPYAGGFITEHYGRPAQGMHAIQIEINRALYLNEQTLVPTIGFSLIRRDLMTLCRRLFAEAPALTVRRTAAE